jgi:hypothetical protein
MDRSECDYLIRDQEGQAPRTLDLLQAWGPPLRPPLRVQIAGTLSRIANWLDPRPESCRPSRSIPM